MFNLLDFPFAKKTFQLYQYTDTNKYLNDIDAYTLNNTFEAKIEPATMKNFPEGIGDGDAVIYVDISFQVLEKLDNFKIKDGSQWYDIKKIMVFDQPPLIRFKKVLVAKVFYGTTED